MSLLEKIWGVDKEKQIKGLVLIFFTILFSFVILTLFLLRFLGIGKAQLISPFVYFFILVFISFILSIKSKFFLSTVILCFLFIEISLGYGGLALTKLGFNTNLIPYSPQPNYRQFIFHPTLGAIPNPNFKFNGLSHSENFLRNTSIKFDTNKPHIAIFGGSTTYDTGIDSDDLTWVSQLDNILTDHSISNNGVPGYSTVEHVIQTSFYANRAGVMPICSVYYIGWNDIRNFGIESLDNGYANFHLLSQYSNLKVRRYPNSLSPTLNLFVYILSRKIPEIPFPSISGNKNKAINEEDKIFEIVKNNLESIVNINSSRGTRTVIIAQMLNKKALTESNGIYGWLPYVYDSKVWPLQSRFNNYLKDLSNTINFDFIDPGISNFIDTDFVDKGHFNEIGANKFAKIISPKIKKFCK